jgi:hypothetical protein
MGKNQKCRYGNVMALLFTIFPYHRIKNRKKDVAVRACRDSYWDVIRPNGTVLIWEYPEGQGGEMRNTEIDFVAKREDRILYLQVVYLLTDEPTIEYEYGAFR